MHEKLIASIHCYFLAKVGHLVISDVTKKGWTKKRVHI